MPFSPIHLTTFPRFLGAGWLLGLGLAILGSAATGSEPAGEDYRESIESWHGERGERLRSDTGWLTIAGLFWLEPGSNEFGSDPGNPVSLPAGPARAGEFRLQPGREGARVVVVPAPDAGLRRDGEAVTEETVIFGPGEDAAHLQLDRLEFWIIERGGRYAVRVRDPESSLRTGFTGVDHYPVEPAYRVAGRLLRQDPVQQILLPNFIGYVDTVYSPGPVQFELFGASLSLFPVADGPADSTFFFVFADGTSGVETYGGGRFLYADLQADGRIVLDFNKAYNPPCAFNPNTTCPLPPEGNTLAVPVRAGEKDYVPEDN